MTILERTHQKDPSATYIDGAEWPEVEPMVANIQQVETVTASSNSTITLDDYSEDSLSLKFVNQFGEFLRYTAGRGWMYFNGKHWERDELLIRFNMTSSLCREVAENVSGEKRERIKSAKTRNAIVEITKANSAISIKEEVWDAIPSILNTPGGVVDLKNAVVRQNHSGDHCTQITSVTPDSVSPPTRFLKFLNEVFEGDQEVINFMQRFLGYCLTGEISEQVLLFALGAGSNGKSTLLDLVMTIMGSYAKKLPINVLTQSKHDRHPTELAQLVGVRLAISSEPEKGHQWAEARIKELTGDKTLTARFMRGDNFEFNLTQKHFIAGNYQPRLKGNDPAMARRMILIPFNAVFSGAQKDPGLPKKLDAESGSILSWMIEGAVEWYANGLKPPEKIIRASAEYMESQDDLAAWIEECCITGANCKQGSGDLYRNFTRWKDARNEPVWSQTEWGKEMATKNFTKKKTGGKQQYAGIESVSY
ncbi:MAG: phage/plasmid primase, P4 family [Oceanicoccus sp.]